MFFKNSGCQDKSVRVYKHMHAHKPFAVFLSPFHIKNVDAMLMKFVYDTMFNEIAHILGDKQTPQRILN